MGETYKHPISKFVVLDFGFLIVVFLGFLLSFTKLMLVVASSLADERERMSSSR